MSRLETWGTEGGKDLVIDQMVTGSTLNTLRCSDKALGYRETRGGRFVTSLAAVRAGELPEGHSCVFGRMFYILMLCIFFKQLFLLFSEGLC